MKYSLPAKTMTTASVLLGSAYALVSLLKDVILQKAILFFGYTGLHADCFPSYSGVNSWMDTPLIIWLLLFVSGWIMILLTKGTRKKDLLLFYSSNIFMMVPISVGLSAQGGETFAWWDEECDMLFPEPIVTPLVFSILVFFVLSSVFIFLIKKHNLKYRHRIEYS